ncbi:MAG: hypothetical protein ACTHOH_11050 [Lysobacteraceae bacterium]
MCTFILAVLPKDADADAVKAIFRTHGRACVEAGRLSSGLLAGLAPGERFFHTTPAHCDCGTPLGEATLPGRDPAQVAEATAARLRRKGWSEAKIARSLAQQTASDERPPRPNGDLPPTSLADWVALIDTVLASNATRSLGLLWCELDDVVDPADRPRIRRAALDQDALARMRRDVIHDFTR